MPLIIDPASSEVNRGSFCYLPYLLQAYYANHNYIPQTVLLENFTVADYTELEQDLCKTGDFCEEIILCGLWSYPQIETAIMLWLFFKENGINLRFFGYEPLIKRLGLPLFHVTEEMILDGMKYYVQEAVSQKYKHIMLSDCDKHLNGLVGKVMPMFASYGCPRGCSFCSASLNTGHKRFVLDMPDVRHNLELIVQNGWGGIHFTDEDFFFDTQRAVQILQIVHELDPDMHIIALGHTDTFLRFYEYVKGNPQLFEQMKVLKLVECGLETADKDSAKVLGKHGIPTTINQQAVAENELCKVLWLTMSFYPGDTIASMNNTGLFLSKYGLDITELNPRIRTNGTEAGLGQFYQMYDGCTTWQALGDKGKILTHRPMRLWPSFLPYSWLYSLFRANADALCTKELEYRKWCHINRCSEVIAERVLRKVWSDAHVTQTPFEIVFAEPNRFEDEIMTPQPGHTYLSMAQRAIAVATMARLRMIEERH